ERDVVVAGTLTLEEIGHEARVLAARVGPGGALAQSGGEGDDIGHGTILGEPKITDHHGIRDTPTHSQAASSAFPGGRRRGAQCGRGSTPSRAHAASYSATTSRRT